jgi:Ferritin-like
VPWERGLQQNYTGSFIISFKVRVRERIPCFLKDVYGDQPLFANTDMAKRWHLLGFVVQRPSEGPEPIFVETQRGDLHKDSYYARKQVPVDAPRGQLHTLSTKPRRRYGHGIPLPKPKPGNDPIVTVESLREHLQTAMAVELSTIPLYLFGMYSVQTPKEYVNDPRYYNPITGAIRSTFDSIRISIIRHPNAPFFCSLGVVAEEMLHLSLAGNILLAVGGEPKVYDPLIIPQYPMLMPGRVPDLELNLRSMTKDHLQTFIEVFAYMYQPARPWSLHQSRSRRQSQKIIPDRNRMNIIHLASSMPQLRKVCSIWIRSISLSLNNVLKVWSI